MKFQRGYTLTGLIFALFNLLVAVLGVIGWVMNIIATVAIANDPITGMFILRVIGIFLAPLGAILGWL